MGMNASARAQGFRRISLRRDRRLPWSGVTAGAHRLGDVGELARNHGGMRCQRGEDRAPRSSSRVWRQCRLGENTAAGMVSRWPASPPLGK